MAQKYVKLNSLVFYCTSQEQCKRSACIVHGEQCYYLTAKTIGQQLDPQPQKRKEAPING